VEAVSNGREALDAVLRTPPDIVLADVMMPELDGLELVRILRAHAKTASIP
jgi:CheY-like chemotaxis protein